VFILLQAAPKRSAWHLESGVLTMVDGHIVWDAGAVH
jgi:hypothetical protein